MSLQKPPSAERSSRLIGRLLFLIILLAFLAVAIWAAVTLQRIELVEDTTLDSLERATAIEVNGLSIDVEEGDGGPIPVILLHDFDVSGSVLLEELAADIEGGFRPVLVDLPGFGLSQRIPEVGDRHTVASMAETVGSVISQLYDLPVVVVGVGLGGQVAAELAVTQPELMRGLVMIDVDFSREGDWVSSAEGLPYIGPAVIHTFEAGGRFGVDRWAPNCDEGGWCPTAEQIAVRDLAASLQGTTESLAAFMETPRSSLVPSELDGITVPAAYVWSTEGPVTAEAVETVTESVPEITLLEADVWKAHLQSIPTVLEAVELVSS
jgi:pimeloyl-ACP methyl ester carboxylesterase